MRKTRRSDVRKRKGSPSSAPASAKNNEGGLELLQKKNRTNGGAKTAEGWNIRGCTLELVGKDAGGDERREPYVRGVQFSKGHRSMNTRLEKGRSWCFFPPVKLRDLPQIGESNRAMSDGRVMWRCKRDPGLSQPGTFAPFRKTNTRI